jgi:hypothetical protein
LIVLALFPFRQGEAAERILCPSHAALRARMGENEMRKMIADHGFTIANLSSGLPRAIAEHDSRTLAIRKETR